VIIFLAVGALMIAGMLAEHGGGRTMDHMVDPASGAHAPFVGGLSAVLLVFWVAGFSSQGTESVAWPRLKPPIRSGTCQAIRSVFWRILLFYSRLDFLIGTLIGFTDPTAARR